MGLSVLVNYFQQELEWGLTQIMIAPRSIQRLQRSKNANTGQTRLDLSAEQLLALDPDVIILMHTREQWKREDLYEREEYKAIQGLNAVKNKRVYSICRLELFRYNAGLEFPIEMLIEAKAAYPKRFEDVNVGEQLTTHYKEIYGLDDDQVEELKVLMGLDWMDEEGF